MTVSITPKPADHVPDRGDVADVVQWVFSVATSLDGFTAQLRRAYGMNAHERLAVAALWGCGPMTMTELGQWIPLSRAAVTTLVDRLEALGVVQRGSDPADRRRTVVSVLDSALLDWSPVYPHWRANLMELVGEFTPEEWSTIVRFHARLRTVNDDEARRLKQMTDDELRSLVGRNDDPVEGASR
jgi:DNA-binding MarR family transcriptional regulator